MSRAYNAWNNSEAEQTTLADDVRQVVILTVGGVWNAAYEIYAHTAAGHEAGLSDAAMLAITQGLEPDELNPAARDAFRFMLALVRDRQISDELITATVQALTLQGVADMVQLIGLYLATFALLNAFRFPLSAFQRPQLPNERPFRACPIGPTGLFRLRQPRKLETVQ